MITQDYISLVQESISVFSDNFFPIFANILAAAIAIIVGLIIGWVLKRIIERISVAINLERSLQNLSFYSTLVKSQDKIDLTTLVGEIARWTAIVIFLIPAIASLQIEGSYTIFSQVFAYITNVVLASLYLLFGFVIGWFVHRALLVVGSLVGNNPSHLIANIAYGSFIVFASLQALVQLGVSGDYIRYIIIALLLVGVLAFGLGGKDLAVEWLKKGSASVK